MLVEEVVAKKNAILDVMTDVIQVVLVNVKQLVQQNVLMYA